jgi:hypothetical protein
MGDVSDVPGGRVPQEQARGQSIVKRGFRVFYVPLAMRLAHRLDSRLFNLNNPITRS